MTKFWYFTFFILIQVTAYTSAPGQEKYVDSLKKWIRDHPKVDSQYILTLHRISYRTSESDVKTSFEYYEKVTTYSNELNFTYGKALAQINLGILLSNSANFDASNAAYFKAIEYAQSINSRRLISVCYNNIGENFRSLKDLSKCREYTRKAIDINKQLKAWRGVAINYELLQQCDLSENLFASAKKNLDSGMNFALLSGDSYIIALYYLGFGKIEAINGNMHGSSEFFDKAMVQASLEDDMRNKFLIYLARSTYLKGLNNKERLSYLDSAYDIALQTSYMEGIGQAAQLLSDNYDKTGNKDSSLKYFQIYRKAYDTVFSENNKRNVIIKEADWMIKQKEIENKHLQSLAALQKKDLGFKNLLLAGAVALLLLAGVVAFFVYQNFKVKKNRQLAEFEKNILSVKMESLQSQMNPHFIFNCLNSIENFVMRNEKLAASQYLNKFASLMRVILESSKLDSIPFATSLRANQNYVELERVRFNNKFEVITEIDPELYNPKYRVPPLIIQPYLENAINHGLAPSEKENLFLKLKVYLDNDYIVYIVEDNGIGRDLSKKYQSENPIERKSFGMRLNQEKINIFNQQHKTNADLRVLDLFENEKPAGTRIILRIKVR